MKLINIALLGGAALIGYSLLTRQTQLTNPGPGYIPPSGAGTAAENVLDSVVNSTGGIGTTVANLLDTVVTAVTSAPTEAEYTAVTPSNTGFVDGLLGTVSNLTEYGSAYNEWTSTHTTAEVAALNSDITRITTQYGYEPGTMRTLNEAISNVPGTLAQIANILNPYVGASTYETGGYSDPSSSSGFTTTNYTSSPNPNLTTYQIAASGGGLPNLVTSITSASGVTYYANP